TDARALVLNTFTNIDSALKAYSLIAPTVVPGTAQLYLASRDLLNGRIVPQRGQSTFLPGPFDIQILQKTVHFRMTMPTREGAAVLPQYMTLNFAISPSLPGYIKIGSNLDDLVQDGFHTVRELVN